MIATATGTRWCATGRCGRRRSRSDAGFTRWATCSKVGLYSPASGLSLRVGRFCNFCRELTAFRVFFRTGLLQGWNQAAFDTWRTTYRVPFFARYGFSAPTVVQKLLRCPGGAAQPVLRGLRPVAPAPSGCASGGGDLEKTSSSRTWSAPFLGVPRPRSSPLKRVRVHDFDLTPTLFQSGCESQG